LVALHVLFQEKNVTRAAEKLCLSQAAMSNNLRELREIFENPLLIRENNKMVLTDFALQIKPTLQEVLLSLENLIHYGKSVNLKSCARTFKIGMSDKWASLILPKLMPILLENTPHLKINVVPFIEICNMDPFQKLQCDITIGRSAKLPKSMHQQLLREDSLMCVFHKNHPLSKRKRITIDNYLSYKHIVMRTENNDFGSFIDEYLEEINVSQKRDIVLYLPYLDALLRLIENSSNFIATLSESSAQLIQEKYDCVIRPLALERPVFKFYIAWDKKHDSDLAHVWLRNKIIQIVMS